MIDRAPDFVAKSPRRTPLLIVAALAALSCGPALLPYWQQPCGGKVTAALSSVTLADNCGEVRAGAGAAAPESDFADCAPAGCGCRQSSMQLAFASTAQKDTKIEIKAVRLINSTSGKTIETLRSREPQQWVTDKYVTWDEILVRSGSVKATYKLSAPTYGSGSSAGIGYYSTKYIVEVDVEVDGELRTLSIEASREPDVVT